MSAAEENISLAAADYVVFGVMLGISTIVGIFFAIKDRKAKSDVDNYLLGGRKIFWPASAISTSLSFLSAVSVLGIPSEMVYYGGAYCMFEIGILLSNILSCELFLPVYYNLGLSSAYEYIGLRFGPIVRYIATIIYLLQTITYTGVMIFAPALVLNAVANFSLWGCVLSVGAVCIIYTTLGGLKAVIWTDVIQGILLVIVLLVVLFMSAEDAGGFDHVWQTCRDGDRFDFFQFDFDPRYRLTFWSVVFGLGIMWTSIASTNQAVSQRFLCCESVTAGKKAIYWSWICGLAMVILLYLIGFIAYAYFGDCDPLLSGKITAGDQILPYMAMLVFRKLPGMSGLFIAGLFAAGLSTISSALNGMSSVTVSDLIKPNVKWSNNTLLWVSKGLTFVYGIICIGFAYLSSILGGLIQATLSLLGICAGPLLGPVVMGTLFPFTNSIGAASGMLVSLAFNIWLYIGSTIYPPLPIFLRAKNITTSGCIVSNSTQNTTTEMPLMLTTSLTPFAVINTTQTTSLTERPPIADFYSVSFTLYALYGLIVCLLVGFIASCASGGLKSRYYVNPRYINLPFEHKLLRWLPEKFRRIMRPTFIHSEDSKYTKADINQNDVTSNGNFEDHDLPGKKVLGRENSGYIDEDTITTSL